MRGSTTTRTLRGDFPSPADPPGQPTEASRSRAFFLWQKPILGLFLSRAVSAVTGIEPGPTEATYPPLHCGQGDLRLSLNPSLKGHFVAP